MNATGLIALALMLLQSVLDEAKAGTMASDVIQNLEAAIASLMQVQGTDVTYSQLESLRVKVK